MRFKRRFFVSSSLFRFFLRHLRSICLTRSACNHFYRVRSRVCEPWKVVYDDSRGVTAVSFREEFHVFAFPTIVYLPTYLPIHRHNPLPRLSRRFAHRDVKSFARIFSATATLSFSFPSPLVPPLLLKIRHADFSHPVPPVLHRRWLTFRREISSPWLSVPGSSQRYYTPIVIIVITTRVFFSLPDFFLHSPHLIRFRNRAIAKCLACARFGVPFLEFKEATSLDVVTLRILTRLIVITLNTISSF